MSLSIFFAMMKSSSEKEVVPYDLPILSDFLMQIAAIGSAETLKSNITAESTPKTFI